MTCHDCRTECRKSVNARTAIHQCSLCRKVFTDARDNALDGMYLPIEKAEMVLRLLLEGNSVSSVERTTEVHHTTILKLLAMAGEKCERIMAENIRNVEVRDVEADEFWAYIGKKQKRVRPEDDQNLGDCYTFVAIERHTKLVLNINDGASAISEPQAFSVGIRQPLPASGSRSPRTGSHLTATRSSTRSATAATSLCSSRSTVRPAKAKAGIALPKSSPSR